MRYNLVSFGCVPGHFRVKSIQPADLGLIIHYLRRQGQVGVLLGRLFCFTGGLFAV